MNRLRIHRRPPARRQKGVAALEFALIASVFFTLLIGVMEMGRVLFYFNTAAEATRHRNPRPPSRQRPADGLRRHPVGTLQLH